MATESKIPCNFVRCHFALTHTHLFQDLKLVLF